MGGYEEALLDYRRVQAACQHFREMSTQLQAREFDKVHHAAYGGKNCSGSLHAAWPCTDCEKSIFKLTIGANGGTKASVKRNQFITSSSLILIAPCSIIFRHYRKDEDEDV
jgi:hypothetical protein